MKESKCSVKKQNHHSAHTCMLSSMFMCCSQGLGGVWYLLLRKESAISLREQLALQFKKALGHYKAKKACRVVCYPC